MNPCLQRQWWLCVCTTLLAISFAASGRLFAADAWAQVPEILKRIVPPKSPNRVFDVTKHGAVADGVPLNTKAFAEALAA